MVSSGATCRADGTILYIQWAPLMYSRKGWQHALLNTENSALQAKAQHRLKYRKTQWCIQGNENNWSLEINELGNLSDCPSGQLLTETVEPASFCLLRVYLSGSHP